MEFIDVIDAFGQRGKEEMPRISSFDKFGGWQWLGGSIAVFRIQRRPERLAMTSSTGK